MTPAMTFHTGDTSWLRRHRDATVARNRLQSLIDELADTQAHKRLEPPQGLHAPDEIDVLDHYRYPQASVWGEYPELLVALYKRAKGNGG